MLVVSTVLEQEEGEQSSLRRAECGEMGKLWTPYPELQHPHNLPEP